jgi:hypothetical protein
MHLFEKSNKIANSGEVRIQHEKSLCQGLVARMTFANISDYRRLRRLPQLAKLLFG